MMYIILCVSSGLLGNIGGLAAKACAYKWGFVDIPNPRSSHSRPTPKGGGIGILAAFILASLILKLSPAFWIPAILLSLLGFFGDKFDLSPKIRLPIQFIAATILVQFSNLNCERSAFLLIFFVFFVVSTANWFNFMDGINGIAGITGTIGFSLLACFDYICQADNNIMVLSICIALSCLGFLPLNMPKAKVFMGDVGSILLGFVFAATAMLLSRNCLDFVCLVGFLFPFYADELTTMSVRIIKGENLLVPHRKHFYQLLANEMGQEHWKVSVGYGVLQTVVGVCVIFARPSGLIPVIAILLVFSCGFIALNYVIRKRIAVRLGRTI
jgi:Fuc2NAc and GlcNAc transferase